jgi:hypothetical protein
MFTHYNIRAIYEKLGQFADQESEALEKQDYHTLAQLAQKREAFRESFQALRRWMLSEEGWLEKLSMDEKQELAALQEAAHKKIHQLLERVDVISRTHRMILDVACRVVLDEEKAALGYNQQGVMEATPFKHSRALPRIQSHSA